MSELQRLALKRIWYLAETMNIPMGQIWPYKDHSEEEQRKQDKKCSDEWSVANAAQREILDWTKALLAEPNQPTP